MQGSACKYSDFQFVLSLRCTPLCSALGAHSRYGLSIVPNLGCLAVGIACRFACNAALDLLPL